MSKIKFFLLPVFILLATCNLQLAASYAATDIAAVEKPFMEGRYEKAVLEAQRMIDERARQRYEVYYLKGLAELKLGRFENARQSFEAIIEKYPRSGRVFDAYVGIGDSYLLAGNTEGAVKAYSEIKEKFPSDKNIALVDLRLSDCGKKSSPAEPVALTVDKPEAQTESKGEISVQVGSFKNRRNAERLSAKLAAGGYGSYVELPLAAGDRLYRVKVGRFKSKSEAEDLAAKLNRNGYKTKICDDSACQ